MNTKQFILAISLFAAVTSSAKEIAALENVSALKTKITNVLAITKNLVVTNVEYAKNGIAKGYSASTNAFSVTRNRLHGKLDEAIFFAKHNPYKIGFITAGLVAAAVILHKICNNTEEEKELNNN